MIFRSINWKNFSFFFFENSWTKTLTLDWNIYYTNCVLTACTHSIVNVLGQRPTLQSSHNHGLGCVFSQQWLLGGPCPATQHGNLIPQFWLPTPASCQCTPGADAAAPGFLSPCPRKPGLVPTHRCGTSAQTRGHCGNTGSELEDKHFWSLKQLLLKKTKP